MDETIVWDPYKTSRQPPITDHFSVRSYCSKPSIAAKEKDYIPPSRIQTYIPKYLCRRVKKSRYQAEVDAAFAQLEKSITESKNLDDKTNSSNDVALPNCGKFNQPCLEYLEDSSASKSRTEFSCSVINDVECVASVVLLREPDIENNQLSVRMPGKDSMTISNHLEETDEERGAVILDCDESSL